MIDAAGKVLFCGSGTSRRARRGDGVRRKVVSRSGAARQEWIPYDGFVRRRHDGLPPTGDPECDLLILLGTTSTYHAFLPGDVRIAQVDVRPEVIGRRSRLDLAVWGDGARTLRCLIPRVREKTDRRFLDRMLKKHADALEGVVGRYTRKVDKHVPIHPSTWPPCWTKSPTTTRCSPSTPGCVTSRPPGTSSNGRRRIIGSFSHGSMANALPMADVGAVPDRRRQVRLLHVRG